MKKIELDFGGDVQKTVEELQSKGYLTHCCYVGETHKWLVRGYTLEEFEGDECHTHPERKVKDEE